MLIVVSYLIEAIVFFMWWQNVITKEVKYKGIIRKVCKIVKHNKPILGQTVFNQFDYENEDMAIFGERIKNILGYFFVLLASVCSFVIAPIILTAVFDNNYPNMGMFFVQIILLLGINVKIYVKYTQCIIFILNDIVKIVDFITDHPDFLIMHSKNGETIKNGFKKIRKKDIISLVFLIIFVYITMFYIAPKMEIFAHNGGEWFNQLEISIRLFIIAMCILVYRLINKKNAKKLAKIKVGINIEGLELECYTDIIKKYCEKVGIENIIVKIEDGKEINAYAITKKWDTPMIIFSRGIMKYFESLFYNNGEETMDSIFQFVFCHELIHIVKKDNEKIKKRSAYIGLTWIVLFPLVFILFVSIPISVLRNSLCIFISCFSMFMMLIVINSKFWGQMSELRADKLSAELTGISTKYFELFFKSQNKIGQEQDITNKINNGSIYYRYYKREIEIEYHPNIERRLQVLFNKRQWGILYYIEHAIIIFKWRINKRGWNGR